MASILLRRCIAALVVCTIGFSATAASANNLIGLNFTTAASGTPDPQNWNRVSAPDGVLSNLTDETGAVTGVSAAFGGGATGGFVYLSTATLAADAVPQYMYDLSGMTGYGFRSNGEFFTEFRGLSPNTPYEYWFVAYRSTSAIENLVRVSEGDVADAIQFNQSITGAANNGRFIVNTMNASSADQWNDLSRSTTSSSGGTIRFNWAGVAQTTVVGAIAIREVPEPSMLTALVAAPLLLIRRRHR